MYISFKTFPNFGDIGLFDNNQSPLEYYAVTNGTWWTFRESTLPWRGMQYASLILRQ